MDLIIIIKACRQHNSLDSLSLTIRPYWSLFIVSYLDSTQWLHKADECEFLQVGQHWCVHVQDSIGECLFWFCPYFISMSCSSYWDGFARWEVSGRTTAVLQGAASRICSKQHAATLCSSHLAFSPSVSLESEWCNHTVVLTRLQLGRIPILFHQRSNFHMVNNPLITVHALPMHILISLSVDEILLLRYRNWFMNFRIAIN